MKTQVWLVSHDVCVQWLLPKPAAQKQWDKLHVDAKISCWFNIFHNASALKLEMNVKSTSGLLAYGALLYNIAWEEKRQQEEAQGQEK